MHSVVSSNIGIVVLIETKLREASQDKHNCCGLDRSVSHEAHVPKDWSPVKRTVSSGIGQSPNEFRAL